MNGSEMIDSVVKRLIFQWLGMVQDNCVEAWDFECLYFGSTRISDVAANLSTKENENEDSLHPSTVGLFASERIQIVFVSSLIQKMMVTCCMSKNQLAIVVHSSLKSLSFTVLYGSNSFEMPVGPKSLGSIHQVWHPSCHWQSICSHYDSQVSRYRNIIQPDVSSSDQCWYVCLLKGSWSCTWLPACRFDCESS